MTRKPKRWRKVTMTELRKIWADLSERDKLYCGITDAELRARHGTFNIKHVMGRGWYKLTATP